MRHFWHGFQKGASQVSFKRHVIILYWRPGEEGTLRSGVKQLSSRFPSVKVKVVNATKDPVKLERHRVLKLPTVLLLKDGREVDRVEGGGSPTLLEALFRRALT